MMVIEEDTWTKPYFDLDEFTWNANLKILTYKKVVKHGCLPSNFDVQGRKHRVRFGNLENYPKEQLTIYRVREIDGLYCEETNPTKIIIVVIPWKKTDG
jgi:hypothetical protein